MTQEITQTADSDDCEDAIAAKLGVIFASVSVGDTTPEYWYGVMDRSVAEARAKDDSVSVAALREFKRELQHLFRAEAKFVEVSQTIAYRRLRL